MRREAALPLVTKFLGGHGNSIGGGAKIGVEL